MNAVPVSVALGAGGLAVINPRGFPLLPAFLAFYLADENTLPRAPTRIMQGLLVGALVSIGFLGPFALVRLPVSFGVALVARAVPQTGRIVRRTRQPGLRDFRRWTGHKRRWSWRSWLWSLACRASGSAASWQQSAV